MCIDVKWTLVYDLSKTQKSTFNKCFSYICDIYEQPSKVLSYQMNNNANKNVLTLKKSLNHEGEKLQFKILISFQPSFWGSKYVMLVSGCFRLDWRFLKKFFPIHSIII